MTEAEHNADRAEREGQEDQQAEEERAVLLDRGFPTGGPLRRWLWRVGEGATRYGTKGGPNG